jgi:serine/threonine-protein kinase
MAETVERYELLQEIASGGMASVYVGRLRGQSGFARLVAIKRLHRHLANDPQFVAMFLDEARLAARIRHPNVVSTLDVIERKGELLIVMDYVHGLSLAGIRANLETTGRKLPLPIVSAIVSGTLQGLHAAHEARDEIGQPLQIVHRDVSPQNVLVGIDGVARLVDFGVAKAVGRLQTTTDGQVKGKAAYMSPEQLSGKVDRRTDVFAASVILWELLAGRRLFGGGSQPETIAKVLAGNVPSLRSIDPSLSAAIDEIVRVGLDPDPEQRFATARELDQALVRAIPPAASFDVAEWMQRELEQELAQQTRVITEIEARPPRREGEATDVTGATGAPRSRARSSSWTVVLAVLAAAGIGGTVYFATLARTTVVAASPPAPSPSVTVSPVASLSAAPVPVASTPPTVSSPKPAARPTIKVDAAAPKHVADDCNPPYWIDAKGKHFKDHCL